MTGREKLLWSAFEHAKANPQKYNQESYLAECGTAGCLAYHICVVASLPASEIGSTRIMWNNVGPMAADLMDIKDEEEYYDLFGMPRERLELYDSDKIAWLEQHIRAWIVKYCHNELTTVGDKLRAFYFKQKL